MVGWLFFCRQITSKEYDIVIVGTSAVNCGISSNSLYYIFVKGHPISFLELIQLMGILKRGSGKLLVQDQIHILLSIPNFIYIYHSILKHEDETEIDRQMRELRIVTSVLLDLFFQGVDRGILWH